MNKETPGALNGIDVNNFFPEMCSGQLRKRYLTMYSNLNCVHIFFYLS